MLRSIFKLHSPLGIHVVGFISGARCSLLMARNQRKKKKSLRSIIKWCFQAQERADNERKSLLKPEKIRHHHTVWKYFKKSHFDYFLRLRAKRATGNWFFTQKGKKFQKVREIIISQMPKNAGKFKLKNYSNIKKCGKFKFQIAQKCEKF